MSQIVTINGSPERSTRKCIISDFVLLLLKLFDLTNKLITKRNISNSCIIDRCAH